MITEASRVHMLGYYIISRYYQLCTVAKDEEEDGSQQTSIFSWDFSSDISVCVTTSSSSVKASNILYTKAELISSVTKPAKGAATNRCLTATTHVNTSSYESQCTDTPDTFLSAGNAPRFQRSTFFFPLSFWTIPQFFILKGLLVNINQLW